MTSHFITIPTAPEQHTIRIPHWISDPTSEQLPPIEALTLTRCHAHYVEDNPVLERSLATPFTWPTGTQWFRPLNNMITH